MAEGRKKTSTSNKKPSTKEMADYKREEIRKKLELEEDFRKEITLWLTIACACILELSNYEDICGSIGNALGGFMKGHFGYMAYLIPLLWIVSKIFSYLKKGNIMEGQKFVGSILLVIFICMTLTMLTYGTELPTPKAAFAAASDGKRLGGGALGALFNYVLQKGFARAGTWIINIFMLILSGMLISGKSIMRGIERNSRNVISTAKDTSERRQQNLEFRKKKKEQEDYSELEDEPEEKLGRRKKRVKGIGTDTKVTEAVLPEAAYSSDEMAELHIETYPEVLPVEETTPEPEKLKPATVKQLTVPTFTGNSRRRTGDRHTDQKGLVTYDLGAAAASRNEIPTENVQDSFDDGFELKSLDLVAEEETAFPAAEPSSDLPAADHSKTRRKTRMGENELEAGTNEVALQAEQKESVIAEKPYVFPHINLLKRGRGGNGLSTEAMARDTEQKLIRTLRDFGVDAAVVGHSCGPAVTRFEIQPAAGVKVSRIVGLTDDIKLALAAEDIRIEAPIPGKSAVGIEVPNSESAVVSFRDLIESDDFQNSQSKLSFAVGKDLGGKIKVTDIAKMPHVLIAGATGSGKSVCINTIIMSILYKAKPEEVKLIMIDPKVVELSVYNGIPHLLIPVVTDPKKAAGALNWAVQEMTNRYQDFAEFQVRDIKGYNAKVATMPVAEGEERRKPMPQIVIIVDELADLMMVASKDVEESICRLAQLARAAGIHLVIATQRPSVNVITGLIKANMPSRIAFAVTSGIDSRTILDMNGAEKLLGKGDMLFDPQGAPKPMRVQGAFVSDEEVQSVVDFIKAKNEVSMINSETLKKIEAMQSSGNTTVSIGGDVAEDGRDPLFAEAANIIVDKEKASIGMLQRYLKVGFNRAARIMDSLEEAGVVGPEEGTKPRTVLMDKEKLENYLEENG